MLFAAVLIALLTCVARYDMPPIAATATRPTRSAYSTSEAPSSSRIMEANWLNISESLSVVMCWAARWPRTSNHADRDSKRPSDDSCRCVHGCLRREHVGRVRSLWRPMPSTTMFRAAPRLLALPLVLALVTPLHADAAQRHAQ